jgi:hypothetical protein
MGNNLKIVATIRCKIKSNNHNNYLSFKVTFNVLNHFILQKGVVLKNCYLKHLINPQEFFFKTTKRNFLAIFKLSTNAIEKNQQNFFVDKTQTQ